MRALRVVGIREVDGNITVVLEDPDRRERFTVPGDETLRAAARGDQARLGQIAIEVGNELRPREIQARIRAGASVAELASIAGVPEQKIERFAYPVLLERSRTAELARLAHPIRADGPDRRTLAEVVAATFELRGQTYDDAAWDSWKGEDGRWVVTLAWTAGRSDNRAHWTFQPGANGGTVAALDENAGDLVEGLPARPLRTIGEVIDLARADEPAEEVAAAEAPRRAEPHGEVAPARIEHRPVERRRPDPVVERRRAEHRAEHRSEQHTKPPADEHRATTARDNAHPAEPEHRATTARDNAHPAEPEHRATTARDNAHPGATDRPAEPAAPVRGERPAREEAPQRAGTVAELVAEREAERAAGRAGPPPEHDGTEPARPAEEQRPAPPRRTKKGKPVMPSWDEVLLGVKGQR
ncbi:septation protein SepH [Pseudonocardia sp.]|uniref:septation protein SepH n=1 Tax=Pseudonocardia sp. TaxID=60912 RepID=UPI003D1123F8